MYSQFYLFLYLITSIGSFLVSVTLFWGIVTVISSVIFGFIIDINWEEGCIDEEDLKDKKNGWRKIIKYHLIAIFITFILVCVNSIYPSKKDLLIYYSLKEVDKYNTTHESSNFSTQNTLEKIDTTIDDVSKLIESFLKKSESSSEE